MSSAVPEPPRPRRPRRWLKPLGAVAGVLLLLFAGCELAGWPFLAAPAQRALGEALQRDVLLGQGAQERPTLRFLGGLRVKVPRLQIGAPGWSRQPYFLLAEGADLRISYPALWRAREGHALDIRHLRAERLVVHAERRADGRASWQFGDPARTRPQSGPALQLPTIQELTVRSGDITYVDAPLRADIAAGVRVSEGTLADDKVSGLLGSAKGSFGGAALDARLSAGGVLPLLAPADKARPTPVALDLTAGRAALHFKGTVTDLLKLSGLSGEYRVSGPSLAAVGDPLGLTLPTTGPFRIAGKIVKEGGFWRFLADQASVGSSQLSAALTYDTRPRVPLLQGRVSGPRLLLADLAPSIGAVPAPAPGAKPSVPGERVLPDREFDLPALRAMNANVLMAFERAELGSLFAQPLQPLRTHLTLRDGKLLLDGIVARTADGELSGSAALDGTGSTALWRTGLRWNDVRLERWLRQERDGDAPPYISGRLVGRADLKGQGRSTAQILGSLEGSVVTTLRGGKVSHLAVEAAGIDLAQALGVFIKGDEPLTVQCALVDLRADQGVLRPQAFVIDTGDSNIWVDGSVSLARETMDLRAVVAPKDFSPLSLRTPLRVRGSFSQPQLALEKGPLARQIGAAALLGLVNPVAALIPLLDFGKDDADRKGCAELLERASRAAGGGGKVAAAKPPPQPARTDKADKPAKARARD